jgi:hypothetical protein
VVILLYSDYSRRLVRRFDRRGLAHGAGD